jgi:hypothetical protein
MVESIGDERTRAIFIQMAQVWFRLAEEKMVEPEKSSLPAQPEGAVEDF